MRLSRIYNHAYGHADAPMRRLARADSTLCPTVILSFGSFGRSWVLLWHFLFLWAVGPRILNPDDASFVVVSALLVKPSIQSQYQDSYDF
jgi:hypothetical protein